MPLAKGENAADARRQKSGIKRDRDKVGSGEVRIAPADTRGVFIRQQIEFPERHILKGMRETF